MSCCQCQGVNRFFNNRVSQRELKKYRKKGARGSTRKFIKLLEELDVQEQSLLDIGGGVGIIQHELMKKGLRRVTHIDASQAYLAASREESQKQGYTDKAAYRFGNFTDISDQVGEHDLVTLDKVICCYDDMPDLVKKSCAKARKWYAVVYPRDVWWNKAGSALLNAGLWIIRNDFRTFIHPTAEVNQILHQAGFKRLKQKKSLIWQYVIYEKQ